MEIFNKNKNVIGKINNPIILHKDIENIELYIDDKSLNEANSIMSSYPEGITFVYDEYKCIGILNINLNINSIQ